jgi:hypothetical protein
MTLSDNVRRNVGLPVRAETKRSDLHQTFAQD